MHGRLDDRLRELAALVAPRAEYGPIHGELGPDHVLVSAEGRAVLIDIEGLMHFDAEWEHVFLRLRFHERHAALARPGLDPRRPDLYLLAMRLSLVAGPCDCSTATSPTGSSCRASPNTTSRRRWPCSRRAAAPPRHGRGRAAAGGGAVGPVRGRRVAVARPMRAATARVAIAAA